MRLLLLSLAFALAACDASTGLVAGPYHARVVEGDADIPFTLEFAEGPEGWKVDIVNGQERIAIPRVEVEGSSVVLAMDHYDSIITATIGEGGSLSGRWKKRRRGDDRTDMAFEATPGDRARFDAPPASQQRADAASLAGRWRCDFESEEIDFVGIFERVGEELRGSFLTATGDYRYLAGREDGGVLQLSCFDGAHAFAFRAQLDDEGALRGDFWSSSHWHETWSGVRDDDAALPDAFGQTTATMGITESDLRFPDLFGREHALDDPIFEGRARLLYVFGTWCPNCHDATEYLVELHERYEEQGLAILGLAFEHAGEFERDARQVRRYLERYEVPYPVLVAGYSDKAAASEALPILDRIRSYPTTLFLDHENRIRWVHTGFSGPATGEAHDRLRRGFRQRIEELLAEAPQP